MLTSPFTLRTTGRPKRHLKKNYYRFAFGFKADSASHVALRYGIDSLSIELELSTDYISERVFIPTELPRYSKNTLEAVLNICVGAITRR